MKSFLSQVATYYYNKAAGWDNLSRYCFVFPNKRSGQFFERELKNLLPEGQACVMPQVTTISDFVNTVAGVNIATQLEAVFVLYRAYCDVMDSQGADLTPFDQFVRWATIIVKDFNDIDTCLVDHNEIYRHINDLNDIAVDPLDEDLRREVGRYLNVPRSQADDDKLFVRNNFYSLWNALPAIYKRFHELMDFYWPGKTTTGMAYRRAAEHLAGGGDLPRVLLGYRIVMVGFVWLSKSERAIFDRLRDDDLADFWWDDACWAFNDASSTGNAAARLMSDNVKDYPLPKGAQLEPIAKKPIDTNNINNYHIKVVKVPSIVGQAKVVQKLLTEIGVSDDETRTAVVLPDEALLMPLLSALGNGDDTTPYKNVNVTLGYNMKGSNIVSLMFLVSKCIARARRGNDGVTFYREDIRDFLSHPVIKSSHPTLAMTLLTTVNSLPTYEVPQALFSNTPFAPLLKGEVVTAADGSAEQAVEYIDGVFDFINSLRATSPCFTTTDETGEERRVVLLKDEFLRGYCDQLLQLRALVTRFKDTLSGSTVLYLVNSLASSFIIPFSGEPLRGIQVMGTLETRCLDFDKLIILSANERSLPPRARANSFIANWLRRLYGLPTIEDTETMSSYYFFRLIGRASGVRLVYNTSRLGNASNEPSRFILQLEKLHLCHTLPVIKAVAGQHANEERDISVPNPGPEAMAAIFGPDGKRPLSPSSINQYIKCPLRFYLHYIAGLSDANEPSDFMDASQFGTIVHDSLRDLYKPYIGRQVTLQNINSDILKRLDSTVTRQINIVYLNREEGDLSGNALILKKAIADMVWRAINIDKELLSTPGNTLEIVDLEHPMNEVLHIGKYGMKLRFTIDRIDRLNGTLRIVDYKTGKDRTTVGSVEEMYKPDSFGETCHAMIQLLLYCYAYSSKSDNTQPHDDKILPVIYKLRKPKESGFKINKVDCEYSRHKDEFLRTLGERLDNLLGDAPFTQNRKEAICQYCRYKSFCGVSDKPQKF